MASFATWLRWALMRLHWRLIIAGGLYLAAPHVVDAARAGQLRDACFAVIVASILAWATHIGGERRNGQRAPNPGLFGTRSEDKR